MSGYMQEQKRLQCARKPQNREQASATDAQPGRMHGAAAGEPSVAPRGRMALQQNETLSDQAVTKLALQAMQRYPSHARGKLRLLCRSENATFLVQAAGAKYALRVHRENYHSQKNIYSELMWLDALRNDIGLAVPEAVRTTTGERVQTLPLPDGSHRNVVLFRWIEGDMPTSRVDPRAFRQLGEITAHLHRHSRQWQKPEGFQRITWNHATMLGPQAHWGNWRAAPGLRAEEIFLLETAAARIGENLLAYGQTAQRYGLIHADLRLTNLLLHHDGTRIIDFDDCGMGWFIHDIAAALSFEESCPQAPCWLENWLQGYERAGHLDDRDTDMIPSMVMQRRIQMTAWMASHANTETARNLAPHWIDHTVRLCRRYLAGGMPLGEV